MLSFPLTAVFLCTSSPDCATGLSAYLQSLPCGNSLNQCPAGITHVLWLTGSGLAIGPRDVEQRYATRVDFSDPALLHRLKTSGKRQGIGKAVGLDKALAQVSVCDATAGLGRDALVLAHLGCEVVLLERSPLIHALLADGMRRGALADEPQVREAVSRMQLLNIDAKDYLAEILTGTRPAPEVITLDPMFPARQKTALVKKAMNTLQQLLGPDEDLDEVLALARQCARRRVVVKRPPSQADIAGEPPGFTLRSKAAHFAVYVNSSFASIR